MPDLAANQTLFRAFPRRRCRRRHAADELEDDRSSKAARHVARSRRARLVHQVGPDNDVPRPAQRGERAARDQSSGSPRREVFFGSSFSFTSGGVLRDVARVVSCVVGSRARRCGRQGEVRCEPLRGHFRARFSSRTSARQVSLRGVQRHPPHSSRRAPGRARAGGKHRSSRGGARAESAPRATPGRCSASPMTSMPRALSSSVAAATDWPSPPAEAPTSTARRKRISPFVVLEKWLDLSQSCSVGQTAWPPPPPPPVRPRRSRAPARPPAAPRGPRRPRATRAGTAFASAVSSGRSPPTPSPAPHRRLRRVARPRAARRAELWTHRPTASEIAELEAAAPPRARAANLDVIDLTPETFPAVARAASARAARRARARAGRVPVPRPPVRRAGTAGRRARRSTRSARTWATCPQNARGHVLGHVKDLGNDPDRPGDAPVHHRRRAAFPHGQRRHRGLAVRRERAGGRREPGREYRRGVQRVSVGTTRDGGGAPRALPGGPQRRDAAGEETNLRMPIFHLHPSSANEKKSARRRESSLLISRTL